MDFRLDEGQLELQRTVRRFCADRFAPERLAEREGRPVDRAAWREWAELGVFSVLLPEAEAGLGLGVVEAAIVFEQLGEYLVGGPTLWCTLAAGLVKGAATGEVLVVGTHERGPALVEHGVDVDVLLMLRDDGVFTCPREALPAAAELAPLDPLTPVARFDALPAGTRVGDAAAAGRLRRLGTVLTAATLLGLSEAALDVSRRYALDREQFGVPIGSFQAIQHMLADAYVRTALARSATYAAAAVLDDPGIGDAHAPAAGAKLLAGEAAVANARAAVQIHGGLGFTWEMLPNYLLKRAWVLENAFGDGDTHAHALGAALGASLA